MTDEPSDEWLPPTVPSRPAPADTMFDASVSEPWIIRLFGGLDQFEIETDGDPRGRFIPPRSRELRPALPSYDNLGDNEVVVDTRSRVLWLWPFRSIVVLPTSIAVIILFFASFHPLTIIADMVLVGLAVFIRSLLWRRPRWMATATVFAAIASIVILLVLHLVVTLLTAITISLATLVWSWLNACWWAYAVYVSKSRVVAFRGVLNVENPCDLGGESISDTETKSNWIQNLLGAGTVIVNPGDGEHRWSPMASYLALKALIKGVDESGGNPQERLVGGIKLQNKAAYHRGELTERDVDELYGRGTAREWNRQRSRGPQPASYPDDPPFVDPDVP